MYTGDNSKDTLTPYKSGAKILTGTRTVITNTARNTLNNIHRQNDELLKHNNTIEVEPDLDGDGEGDIEIDVKHNAMSNHLKGLRNLITHKAKKKIIHESLYKSPTQMGQGTTMLHNVVNPYNNKRKSLSVVDQKDRYVSKQDIYPKVTVNNQIMDKRVRKVRSYVYNVNGVPVATKLEHMPRERVTY